VRSTCRSGVRTYSSHKEGLARVRVAGEIEDLKIRDFRPDRSFFCFHIRLLFSVSFLMADHNCTSPARALESAVRG